MPILLPLILWLPSTATRLVLVLLILRALSQTWVTEPRYLALISLPMLIELMALVANPLPPLVLDHNDLRRKQLRRSYLSTRASERANNLRANLFYLLIPGGATFLMQIVSIALLSSRFPNEIESALTTSAWVASGAWLVAFAILKRFGPDYGPGPEETAHAHKEPPPKQKDATRTQGMDADALEDQW